MSRIREAAHASANERTVLMERHLLSESRAYPPYPLASGSSEEGACASSTRSREKAGGPAYLRRLIRCSTESSPQPEDPQATADAETVARPPANLPLKGTTSAVNVCKVASQTKSPEKKPITMKRPTCWLSMTSRSVKSGTPEHKTVPLIVAVPLRGLKCPIGSTVRLTSGGGGTSNTWTDSCPA